MVKIMRQASLQTTQRSSTRPASRHSVSIAAALLFVGSAILALAVQDWRNLTIASILVVLSFAPLLAERWAGVKVPLSVQILYVLLLLTAPYLGGYWRWYEIWQPWDTLVYFYSGIFISFALLIALGKTLGAYRLVLPVWLEVVMLITAKAFIALLWEIGEFVFDLIFGTSTQADNLDTMTDMIAGLGPSLVVAALLHGHRQQGAFKYIGSLLDAGQGKL